MFFWLSSPFSHQIKQKAEVKLVQLVLITNATQAEEILQKMSGCNFVSKENF